MTVYKLPSFVIKIPPIIVSRQNLVASVACLMCICSLSFNTSKVDVTEFTPLDNGIVKIPPIITNLERYVKNGSINSKKLNSQDSTYAYTMWYLKAREGFMPEIYICPAGCKTIAYGHNLDAHGTQYVGETIEDGVITYKEASALLHADFGRQYDVIKGEFPHMEKHKLFAVTTLALNCGLYKIKYVRGKKTNGLSTFWKKLKAGQVPNFETYCKYRDTKGKVILSKNLVRARKFERDLFTYAMDRVKIEAHKFRNIVLKRDIK